MSVTIQTNERVQGQSLETARIGFRRRNFGIFWSKLLRVHSVKQKVWKFFLKT